MCNACGFLCCGSDQFSGCGCTHCGCPECATDCPECGEPEEWCSCGEYDAYDDDYEPVPPAPEKQPDQSLRQVLADALADIEIKRPSEGGNHEE